LAGRHDTVEEGKGSTFVVTLPIAAQRIGLVEA
jgi:hypothetical protein